MGIFGNVIKSVKEVVLFDKSFDKTLVSRFFRYFSPERIQEEMLGYEERKARHIAAKQRITGRGIKQVGMAMEMEYMARESERALEGLEKNR